MVEGGGSGVDGYLTFVYVRDRSSARRVLYVSGGERRVSEG